jgi:hypothetical protein
MLTSHAGQDTAQALFELAGLGIRSSAFCLQAVFGEKIQPWRLIAHKQTRLALVLPIFVPEQRS